MTTPPRGRLARYSAYQLIDYLRERGVFVALIGVIIGWGALIELRMRFGPDWTSLERAYGLSINAIRGILSQLSFFVVVLSVAGVVSNDRKHGYFRLLFSKPVGLIRYYVQAFVVSWVGGLFVVALLLGLWSLYAVPVSPIGALEALSLQFWVVGSTAFLMSTLVKWDWVATGVIWGGSEIFRQIYRNDTGAIAWMVRHLTAPTHVIAELREALFMGRPLDNTNLAWALLYGAVCMILAVVVLKFRPLAQ
jgi:hypothetical protein